MKIFNFQSKWCNLHPALVLLIFKNKSLFTLDENFEDMLILTYIGRRFTFIILSCIHALLLFQTTYTNLFNKNS